MFCVLYKRKNDGMRSGFLEGDPIICFIGDQEYIILTS